MLITNIRSRTIGEVARAIRKEMAGRPFEVEGTHQALRVNFYGDYDDAQLGISDLPGDVFYQVGCPEGEVFLCPIKGSRSEVYIDLADRLCRIRQELIDNAGRTSPRAQAAQENPFAP